MARPLPSHNGSNLQSLVLQSLAGMRALESPVLKQLQFLRQRSSPLEGIEEGDILVLRERYEWKMDGRDRQTHFTVLGYLLLRVMEDTSLWRHPFVRILELGIRSVPAEQRTPVRARLLEQALDPLKAKNIWSFENRLPTHDPKVSEFFRSRSFHEVTGESHP